MIYGTDLGNGAVPAGIDVRELLLLREAGLSEDQVLAAMIRAPLDVDAPADLIALADDPLRDLRAFEDVRLVVRAGRVVSGSRPSDKHRPMTDSPLVDDRNVTPEELSRREEPRDAAGGVSVDVTPAADALPP